MNCLLLCFILLFFVFFRVEAQTPGDPNDGSSSDAFSSFGPGLAVVIGVLAIMFTLTFILLMYAKFCHSHREPSIHVEEQDHHGLITAGSRFSGIDKTVVESLPFFRFSSLKGSKEGLECAVCLSKFEDIEILRLLPKCKHAFHINCVDQWFESHSSCPLCRHKVSAEDSTIFAYSNSLRFLWNQTDPKEESSMDLELFVQREEDQRGSSRFSVGSSFRKLYKNSSKDEESLIRKDDTESADDKRSLHKFKHTITVSDVVFKNRWSSVSSSDLMFLNSEMLNVMSSDRISSSDPRNEQLNAVSEIEDGKITKIKEEMDRKRMLVTKVSRIDKNDSVSVQIPMVDSSTSHCQTNLISSSRVLNQSEKRSMSEITVHSRFKYLNMRNRTTGSSSSTGRNVKEERMRTLWFPIARRTIQWFANRERSHQQPQTTITQPSDV